MNGTQDLSSADDDRGLRRSSYSVMDPTANSVFTVGLDDVTTITKILHELHHADDQSVLVITDEGIRLITAGEKTFQVSAFFAKSIFQRFEFDAATHHQVNFRFVLRDFIESLNLLRDYPLVDGDRVQPDDDQPINDYMKTSLYIQYRRINEPLRMRLENKSNYVINCDLKAFNLPSDSMFCPLAFQLCEDIATIRLNSKKFYEYVSGLDLNSSEFVHLVMGRGQVPLRLSTRSYLGEVELEITDNERDIIIKDIEIGNCIFSYSYKTQFMKPALEALRTSNSVRMTCGSRGLLCIEHFHDEIKQSLPKMPENGYLHSPSSNSLQTDQSLRHTKRSSVEYFISSEAKPPD